MINQQEPSKVIRDGTLLNVHHTFYTIQGEGPHVGRPSVFVRLYGCNLQCPMCDEDYTSRHALQDAVPYAKKINSYFPWHAMVVISGGEPMRQPLDKFTRALILLGRDVQIETNGTLYQDLPWTSNHLSIVCSPKTGKVNPKLVPHVDAWKYVTSSFGLADDGLPNYALEHPAKPSLYRPPEDHPAPIYLQPEDSKDPLKNADNLAACISSCKTHGYRLCLQTHKLIGEE